jgi:hypothetical protein
VAAIQNGYVPKAKRDVVNDRCSEPTSAEVDQDMSNRLTTIERFAFGLAVAAIVALALLLLFVGTR